MRKSNIACFLAGALIFGAVGVFGGQYVAPENTYPIQLNGEDVSIQGYNINDNTYFKLRDISSALGGFEVDFYNETILLSKDGYVYDKSPETAKKMALDRFKKMFDISDDNPNIRVSFQDVGDHYTINAEEYTGDPDFPKYEWGCAVNKDTLEFYNFSN